MPKSFKSVISVFVLIFMLSSCEKGIPTGPTPTGGSNGNPTIPADDFLLAEYRFKQLEGYAAYS
jgi:hypothetical protein